MEYGTRVDDGRGGDVVATRAAAEPDENNQRRVIQLVNPVSRPAELKKIRGISSAVSSADGSDLTAIDELNENLLPVGDRSTLAVSVRHSDSAGIATLTPVVKMIAGVGESKTAVSTMRTGESRCYQNDPSIPEYISGTSLKAGRYYSYNSLIMLRIPEADFPKDADISNASLKIYGSSYEAANLTIAIVPEYLMPSGAFQDNSAEYWTELRGLLIEYGQALDASAWGGTSAWRTESVTDLLSVCAGKAGWLRGRDLIVLIGQTALGSEVLSYCSLVNIIYFPYLETTHPDGVLDYAILVSKTTGCGDIALTSDSEYLSPVLYWDLAGAWSAGVHITALSAGNSITVSGGVI